MMPTMYMTLKSDIHGIRSDGTKFYPTKWTFAVDLYTSTEIEDSGVDWPSIRWQTLQFWLTELVQDIFVYDINDKLATKVLFECQPENQGMSLPGFPSDDLILRALFEKVRAIGDGILSPVKASLKSDHYDVPYHILASDLESTLPDISYVGENIYTPHDKPWWKRKTSDTLDIAIEVDKTKVDEDGDPKVTSFKRKNNEKDILQRIEEKAAKVMQESLDDEFEIVFDPSDDAEEEEQNTDVDNAKIIQPHWNKKT